ncbi:unnamed protein product [marine sediment metagenome]|uniref:Uncharacterized protein n=1 Tax=marine sediment metagenome TaxID=412755 RepID=X1S2A0_9ZZZZ
MRKERRYLEKYQTRLEKLEKVACWAVYGGIAIGVMGFVITGFIDLIRTSPIEFDWLQILGMGVFLGIFLCSAMLLAMIREDK